MSSSDYNDQSRARASRVGGGIFEFSTRDGSLTKKIEGSFRQVKKFGDFFISVDYVDKRLIAFDSNFELVQTIELDAPNYCGVAVDEEANTVYLANSGNDKILSITDFLTGTPKFFDIDVFRQSGIKTESHINDLWLDSGKLFISYFSKSGNYKYGVFDGGVAHLDIDSGELYRDIIAGCWKPHSPIIHNGYLYVLDSMRGRVLNGVGDWALDIGGFVRGIDFAGGSIACIGQSQDMYISSRLNSGSTVSVDSGVYIVDFTTGAKRFCPLNNIMNIHDLKVL